MLDAWADATTDDGNGFSLLFGEIARRLRDQERLSGVEPPTTAPQWFAFDVRCRNHRIVNERRG